MPEINEMKRWCLFKKGENDKAKEKKSEKWLK